MSIPKGMNALKTVDFSGNGGITKLNLKSDPMRDAFGSAEDSNFAEVQSFIKEISDNGVELIRAEHEKLAYSPGLSRGTPGKIYISVGASYSAWCHEIQHMRDDKADG